MELSPSGEAVDKKPVLNPDGSLAQVSVTKTEKNDTIRDENLKSDKFDSAILPVIYDIIRCVEKDPRETATRNRESQECSLKILELQKRFEIAREQVKQLPGIDYNKEEQLQKRENLLKHLKLSKDLIRKYKDITY